MSEFAEDGVDLVEGRHQWPNLTSKINQLIDGVDAVLWLGAVGLLANCGDAVIDYSLGRVANLTQAIRRLTDNKAG